MLSFNKLYSRIYAYLVHIMRKKNERLKMMDRIMGSVDEIEEYERFITDYSDILEIVQKEIIRHEKDSCHDVNVLHRVQQCLHDSACTGAVAFCGDCFGE